MLVLTVNAGSSSIRLVAYSVNGATQCIAVRQFSRSEGEASTFLSSFLEDYSLHEITAVAHRVVHGGTDLVKPCLLTAQVETEIERLSSLAPLHNPTALAWIQASRKLLGADMPQVAVFDTAFYATLPECATKYALPQSLCQRHGVRRYGFHGLAHRAMWQRWRQLEPELPEGGRVISLQLGAGCSVTAIDCGEPRDTSMGFSPLEGLVMATRPGDVDPSVVTYLQRTEDLNAMEMEAVLNESSGLLGVSDISGDMEVLLASNDPGAREAVELYCYRARKYVGAYLAVLGGADAVLFGGGVGENAPLVRAGILEGMTWCGIQLDKQANAKALGQEGRISAPESTIAVWVVPVDEGMLLVQDAMTVISTT